VKKRVGEVSYELELPHHRHMKHLVFHMSQLKRCRLDADHPERAEPPRGPGEIMDKLGLELDKILSYITTGIGFHMKWEYLVRWKNASEEESWESEDSLWRWKKKIAKYERMILRQSGLSRVTLILSGGGCNALWLIGNRVHAPPAPRSD